MRKIDNDSEFIALYVSSSEIFFKTMMVYGFPYPHNQELHVYRDDETLSVDFRDEWGNEYYEIEGEALKDFTKMGVPIFLSRLDTPPIDQKPPPSFKVVLGDSRYHAPTPGFEAKFVPSFGKIYGAWILK